MGRQPLLNINSLEPDREVIEIKSPEHPEGKLWQLRTKEELTPEQLIRLHRLGEKAQEIQASALGEQEMLLLSDFLDELLSIAFVGDYAGELAGVLHVGQKADAARAFSEACLGVDVAGAMAQANLEAQKQPKKKTSTGARR